MAASHQRSHRLRMPGLDRRAAIAASCLALAALGVPPRPAGAASSFEQGRLTTDAGRRPSLLEVKTEINVEPLSGTTGGGFYVLDGLLAGSRDRLLISGPPLKDWVGPTFFVGIAPGLGREPLGAEDLSLNRWADLINDGTLDNDGDLDASLGVIYGEVRNGMGLPVAGATIFLGAVQGTVVYFDEEGEPDPSATETSASGRFLVLDVPPGDVAVRAEVGGVHHGTAYGRVLADAVAGLSPAPALAVAGRATDASGAAVAGATIQWDFDPSVSAVTNGAGAFALSALAEGLDVTLRGSATGYRPALTFLRSRAEVPDLANLAFRFLSEVNYTAYPAAFGVLQAPSLGVIFGRVVDTGGQPVAGAAISLDPSVGRIGYFDAAGNPAPAMLRTSAAGSFIVFNVPLGNVTLSALAPGRTFRSLIAPSVAGAVAGGDIGAFPTIGIRGRILDEQFRTLSIEGSVVSIVEYPYLATITGVNGDYELVGVPAGELLTLRVERVGFKSSHAFMERMPMADLACQAADRSDCRDLFLVSDTAYNNLYIQARTVPNRSRALVSSGVFLSNGNGALGLSAGLTPPSGTLRYMADRKFGETFVTTVGAVQFFNSLPSVSGLSIFDGRNDQATLVLLRTVADAVTLSEAIGPDCDANADGSFANIYPCDGARMEALAGDAFFQWDLGENVKGQIQFAADPTFETIALTSASFGGSKFRKKEWWYASRKRWKKIKRLGPSGTPLFWRVLARDEDGNESTTVPYAFFLP